MGRLDDRVALVTGASRGFGRAIALAFGQAGADVVVNYRTDGVAAAEVTAALDRLGRRSLAFQADVGIAGDVRRLVDAALARFGRVDILVNNAGIMERGLFADVSVDRYARMLTTNVTGTMLCTRAALPPMIERRYGRIVNITSIVGHTGNPGQTNYAAAKAGLVGMSKALAAEVAARGITVNCVAPGFIESAMTDALGEIHTRIRRVTA